MAFIKSCSTDSRNEQSPTCEVVHETNKAHFRNLKPNRFLPSSIGKALAWRSGGPGFNPHWGAIFFGSSLCKTLSDNLTETLIVKNSSVYKKLGIASICEDLHHVIFGDQKYFTLQELQMKLTLANVSKEKKAGAWLTHLGHTLLFSPDRVT